MYLRGSGLASDNAGAGKLRISLKQLFGVVAVTAILASCAANYESWYGIRWTKADAAKLAIELANLDGEISEELATRVAINAAVVNGHRLRILPSGVRRGMWARYFVDGEPADPVVDIECYIVHLEDVPAGIEGVFMRIVGGHCTVCVGLDGSVVHFIPGR